MGAQFGDAAFSTYEKFAEIYDDFNFRNDYEMWLGRKLLPELEQRGLRMGRALDVGCGTGRAFGPLLKRGWQVHGCDISPAMLARAREQFGDAVRLDVADMRELPVFGQFELVLAMNDAVNYLIGDGELELALRGMRANLAPDGLLLFDCNSRLMVRLAYEPTEDEVMKDGRRWTWTGLGRADESVPVYQVRIEGDGTEPIINQERYFQIDEVEAAVAAARLDLVAVLGQREEGTEVVLREPPDDDADHKIVYIARR
ncbi:MAG TPA: class I SAM-dependent methyltransferase [Solirubrobacterales bacterium]|nr:class I SAM-dependent methyltransferase [Solirubrobacterales bacterium]